MCDESFTPASRLSNDSARSPIWPNVPIINPITIASLSERKSSTRFFANIMAKIANTNPKIAPSQLFLGLTRGNNLCLPKAVPPKNAAESQIQIVAKIDIIKYPP